MVHYYKKYKVDLNFLQYLLLFDESFSRDIHEAKVNPSMNLLNYSILDPWDNETFHLETKIRLPKACAPGQPTGKGKRWADSAVSNETISEE